MRDSLNEFLTNWGVPLFMVLMLLGAIVGILRNWGKINSKDFDEKKEGMFGALYIVLYVIVAIAILGGIMAAVSAIDLSI